MNCRTTEGIGTGPAARAALDRLLASEEFSRSVRLQRFLTYIVEKTLAGCPEDIKEYNIGVAVFDRESTFDPRTDTIVRVEARRLRQQLESYYRSAGQYDTVMIQVPKGGYAPVFQLNTVAPATQPPMPAHGRRIQWWWAAPVLLCLVPLTLWRLGAYPFRRVPHSWTVERSILKVLDVDNRLCWDLRLPETDASIDATVQNRVLIADIDADGHPEVLVNIPPKDIARHGGYLQCYEHDGRLRWTRHHGARKTFGDRTFEARYAGVMLRVAHAGGRPRLIAVANHYIWYPSQTVLLDPHTGAVEDEYWHPGAIHHCLLRDLDGDGDDEVVLAAINNPGNGLGHAAVAALKIPFSKVRRREEAVNRVSPLLGGRELAYVLFPLPDVSRVMGQLPIILRLTVDGSDAIMVMTPIPEAGGLLYTLDSRLAVRSFRASDNFLSLHERYRKQNLLDHELTPREEELLGKVVSFPSAPDGNDPALERHWK